MIDLESRAGFLIDFDLAMDWPPVGYAAHWTMTVSAFRFDLGFHSPTTHIGHSPVPRTGEVS